MVYSENEIDPVTRTYPVLTLYLVARQLMSTFYGAAIVPCTCMLLANLVQSDNKPLTYLMVHINNCLVTLSVTVFHLQY